MRFVFTSYSSSPEFTSPERWLARIAFYTGILESLSRMHVVTGIEQISYKGEFKQKGVNYVFIPHRKKVNRFPFKKNTAIKQLKPDVVFINGFIFPLQTILLRLKLGFKVKIIILHRAERPFTGYKKILQVLADKFIDAYFFTSFEFGNTWIENGIVRKKSKFHEIIQSSSIFKPANKSIAKQRAGMAAAPIYLWVGRLDENKDPLTVISGFFEFLKYSPHAKLYMIYQAKDLLKVIEEKIRTNEKHLSSIMLIGTVHHSEMENYYNASDFIISGSHYEGSGIAVCEAMSCGCIPILTNIPSFRKMTNDGEFGLLYEAGNENSLLAALLYSLDLNIQKEQESVKSHFLKELSFDAIARKTNEVVESLFSTASMQKD